MPENIIKAAKSDNAMVEMADRASMSEKTKWETAVDPDSQYNPWNPDELYQKAGDYSIYESMLNDDQVSVAMQIKKDLVIGSGWSIECQDDEQEDIKSDLEMAFKEDCEKSFDDALNELLSAYDYGFSVSEKQFKNREDGSLTLKTIKTRDPVSWLFHLDEFGNLIQYEQQGTEVEFSNIDPDSLIHYVNNPKFGNPYGTSDLRSAYRVWFIKNQIVKYYAIALEKAASPIPTANYDPARVKKEQIDEMYRIVKSFQTKTAIVFPKTFDLEFLQANGDFGKLYLDGIAQMNMSIGRALFLPDLLGFQGGPTTGGSQALGREQMVVFFKHIARRRRTLENVVNQHLVAPIVRWNWGDVEHYPKFRLKPISEDVATENAKLWLEAVKGRAFPATPQEINHFRSIVDFPESEIEENGEDPIDDRAREEKPTQDETGAADNGQENDGSMDTFAQKKPYDLPSGTYHQKVNFKALEQNLDAAQNRFMAEAGPLITEMIDGLLKKIDRKNIVQGNKVDKLDDLSLDKRKVAKLRKILDKNLATQFTDAQVMARQELLKDNFAQPASEFLKTLAAEDFNFINDWEYEITKGARVAIVQAIKDGKPISSVVEFVNDETKQKAMVSAERYSRTKFTEVMNKGRKAYFESSKVVAGYQYSAILDDRTTEICRGLHGKKFKAGTEPVPPMHFNCRSLLIPITKYEEFAPDEKVEQQRVDDFIEEKKGKGFSKQ